MPYSTQARLSYSFHSVSLLYTFHVAFGCRRCYGATASRRHVENSLNSTEAKWTTVALNIAHLMLYTVYFTGLYERETNLNFEYGSFKAVFFYAHRFSSLFFTSLQEEDCSVCDLERHAIFILFYQAVY